LFACLISKERPFSSVEMITTIPMILKIKEHYFKGASKATARD
jgi:hypothetical protein